MRTEAADQRINRIELREAEESHPQLKVAGAAPRIINAAARALPQATAPERGLLLNVAICARQKSPARPLPQPQSFHRHALIAESRRAPSDPLDFRKRAKHTTHHEQRSRMQQIGPLNPSICLG